MLLTKQLLQKVCEKSNTFINDRRHFHENPELSGNEYQTKEYILSRLQEIGISDIKTFKNLGIAANIHGAKSGKVVGIRADMDALPIPEENQVPYASKNKGVMHACGHDAHMAILLGLAEVLYENKDKFEGVVKLVFQPSEEVLPGGAVQMINEGVLENPKVNYMLALHVLPEMNVGKVGFRQGMYMASSDELHLSVKGKGGHAAFPNLVNNPLLCAAKIITSIHQDAKELMPNTVPFVLQFGRFIAEGRTNIIPEEAKVEGTFRTFDEKCRNKVHELIYKTVQKYSEKFGTTSDMNIVKGYQVVHNDEQITEQIQNNAILHLGSQFVEDLPLRMTSDDFAAYSHIVPSCYFRIGVKNNNSNLVRNLHTPLFDIDETALITGVQTMLIAIATCLSN